LGDVWDILKPDLKQLMKEAAPAAEELGEA